MDAINLLIVDDEERFLLTHKKLMEKRGIRTATCANGDGVLKIVEEQEIDVVLLDIKMPGLDGLEILNLYAFGSVRESLINGTIFIQVECANISLDKP